MLVRRSKKKIIIKRAKMAPLLERKSSNTKLINVSVKKSNISL